MTAHAAPPVPIVTPSVRLYTPDEVLRMDGLFELVRGRLVEKHQPSEDHMGLDANWTASRINYILNAHLIGTGDGGDLLSEQTYRCFPGDPPTVRRPDVSFVAAGRVPNPPPPGHLLIVPDLAIEVVSPSDTVDELEFKLADYEAVALPLVWVVIPAVRMVRVLPHGGPGQQLLDGDTLNGGSVLPGFAVAVADLFRPAAANG